MKKTLLGIVLLGGALLAQPPGDYLDITAVRVRPEKRAEFDALSSKFAEINRKNKGDTWLAYEPMYGQQNTVYFVASRKNFAGIEEGMNAFMGAFMKALGPAGMAKLFQDANNTSLGTSAVIRRRRWDLTAGAPSDAAAANKLIAESRYLRIATVHVRPGLGLAYEEQLKTNKEARERANPGVSSFVSQTVAGGSTFDYYVTSLVRGMGHFAKIKPLPELRGQAGYRAHQQAVAQDVSSVDVMIARFIPELSNPDEAVVKLDPKFWRPAPPKPAAAKKPADAAKK